MAFRMTADLKRSTRVVFLASLLVGCAERVEYQSPALPPPPPAPPVVEPEPLPEPYAQPAPPPTSLPDAAAPPAAQTTPMPPTAEALPLVYAYPTGRWVYTVDHGWIWVPDGATTAEVEGMPYVYLYTLAFGWTWYVSPWGWGPYHYGLWFRHPWHPGGWHGYWVAHPRVIHRIGPGRGRR